MVCPDSCSDLSQFYTSKTGEVSETCKHFFICEFNIRMVQLAEIVNSEFLENSELTISANWIEY
jgi:hypothetical protein